MAMASRIEMIDPYAALGLGESATEAEVEAAYGAISDLLQSDRIPPRLRRWAAVRQAEADAAYAVLTDPDRKLSPAAAGRRSALRQPSGAEPAASPASRATAGHEAKALPTRRDASAADGTASAMRRSLKAAILGLAVVVLAASVYLLYQSGANRAQPSEQEVVAAPAAFSAPAVTPVDPARISELEARVKQNPRDSAALFELGESYFQAGEWQKSIEWFTKLTAIDPKNLHALTDIGTANLNLGNDAAAKEAWTKALAIDANDPQVHYNLGFLYARSDPPDLEAAIAEWETVVKVAPDSSLAQIARTHLEGLRK